MQVSVTHDGDVQQVECDEGSTIHEILTLMEIHPSTVLAVHDGTIIPHDSQLNSDVAIELVTVSSGG
ncbi:MAG: MoaD/ThiS family protein [Euryarchaeota archaeon]|jgi:sulfur carrier protein ThiS|nr:MoaD/ThiS family protein [Euryarchaeota archaeon]